MNLVGIAILEKLSTRRDNTVSVVLGTQEIGDEQAAKLMSFRNKYVKFLITDGNINQEQEGEIERLTVEVAKAKTPSRRLRARIYVLHKEAGISVDFKEYYENRIEQFINLIHEEISQLS